MERNSRAVRHNNVVKLRLSTEQLQLVRNAAEARYLTVSEYLRMLVNEDLGVWAARKTNQ